MKIKTSLGKVNEAIHEILRAGGDVTIDGSGGIFSIKGVEGRFHFDQEDEVITIVISDKPWMASESMIENEIKKFFN